jgi:hypothetical protein
MQRISPVEYRKESVKKISKEAADYVSKKLFWERQ